MSVVGGKWRWFFFWGGAASGGDGLAVQSGSTVAIVDTADLAANRAALGSTTVGIPQAVSQQLTRSNKTDLIVVAADELDPGMLFVEEMPFAWGRFWEATSNAGMMGRLWPIQAGLAR